MADSSGGSNRIKVGDGADLMIFHDGTNSKLQNDTGELIYMSDTHRLRSHTTADNHIVSVDGGAVELYHDNSKKLETTSGGVTVTGTVAATAYTGDGSALSGVASTVADGCIYENSQTISNNYTITTNKNAMSAGPITIASGATLTIPSGSTYTIV